MLSRPRPFTDVFCVLFYSPPFASFRCFGGVVVHCNEWITRGWKYVSLTAEVLDYSFTSAVSDRGHVERTSLLFTAVESNLNERQVGPQLFHGIFRENCLVVMVTADSTVRCFNWQLKGVWSLHCVGNGKPTSWKQGNIWVTKSNR